MLRKDIVISLDDGEEYGITQVEKINGLEYALLININKRSEVKICKIIQEEEGFAVVEIKEEDLKVVYPIFYKSAKTYLDYLMKSLRK